MGYRREPKHYKLKFEDPEMNGLEVTAKSLKLREFLEMSKLMSFASEANAEELYRKFAGAIVEWNLLDDDDQPVPAQYAVCKVSGKPGSPGAPCPAHEGGEDAAACDYTGLVDQEMDFVLSILQAWQQAIAGVDSPLHAALNSGATSLEASLPMASL